MIDTSILHNQPLPSHHSEMFNRIVFDQSLLIRRTSLMLFLMIRITLCNYCYLLEDILWGVKNGLPRLRWLFVSNKKGFSIGYVLFACCKVVGRSFPQMLMTFRWENNEVNVFPIFWAAFPFDAAAFLRVDRAHARSNSTYLGLKKLDDFKISSSSGFSSLNNPYCLF